ncbi:HIT family protein [Candidatus Woesearchaeota archaeon]|nr:HIT family protein [Candidatus Woesearchaeota archaeon]
MTTTKEENVIVGIPEHSCVEGELAVTPKQKFIILEETPDEIVGELFTKANEETIKLFKEKKVQGVNILIQNGTTAGQTKAQLQLRLIPRRENDGIPLTWNPRQSTEEHLAESQKRITKALKEISEKEREKVPEPAPKQQISQEKKPSGNQATKIQEEEKQKEIIDYRVKQMRKTP